MPMTFGERVIVGFLAVADLVAIAFLWSRV